MVYRRAGRFAAALVTALGVGACTNDFDALISSAGAGGRADATSSQTGGPVSSATAGGGGTGGAGNQGGAGAGGMSAGGAASSTATTGGAMPGSVDYAPSVADCVDTTAPNPDACEAEASAGRMFVDTNYSGNNAPRHAFIRFDVDGAVAGKAVTSAVVRLMVSDNGSVSSGELWEVTPFSRLDLFSSVPANVGAAALGATQAANAEQAVDFVLPVSMIAADVPIHLGLRPDSSDAPFYWNNNGATPPMLRVEYQ